MERFHSAVKGEPKDRVPIFPMNALWVAANFPDFPYAKIVSDPTLMFDAQIWALESIGYDWLDPHADPLYISEAFGCGIRFLETGPLIDPLPHSITDLEDVDKLYIPDPQGTGRLPVILETTRRLSAYGGGNIPVVAPFEGPFTTTCRILDAEMIMRMIYKQPQILEALLDKIAWFLLEFGRALIENGANVVLMPEPTGSPAMISPPMFRKFILPRLQMLTSELAVPCILHICGDTSSILDAMQDTGAAVLSLDQCMNLLESREVVPEAVLGGNVDPINALLMGTGEQVVHNTLNCLQTGGTSRFILMSGCAVPPDTSVENLKAMVEAAIDYGLGPGKD